MKQKCEICKIEIEKEVFQLDDLKVCEHCYKESLECDDCQYDTHKAEREEDDLAKFKEEKTKDDYLDEQYHREKEELLE